MKLQSFDKNKFIDAFLNSGSYKHLNLLVSALMPVFEQEISSTIETWINNPQNITWLAFIEHLVHPEKCTETFETAYQELLQSVTQGTIITVADWQERTKGTCLLYANGQYFANTYVALQLCMSINSEVWNILQPAVQQIAEAYPNEWGSLSNIKINQPVKEILPFVCIRYFDDMKWFYEFLYGVEIVQKRQREFFSNCLSITGTYLKA